MIYKGGNELCINCPFATVTVKSDLDVVEETYLPTYESPRCNYCNHCYDTTNNY